MNEVFRILRQIEQTSSRNAKKEILRQNGDNDLLKKFFLYAYDSRRVYGIGSKSIRKYEKRIIPADTVSVKRSLFDIGPTVSHNVFKLLDELVKHPFGSGEDIRAVNEFLGRQELEAYDWYTRLILKDLKIGCTASTVNEVLGDFIPTFEVMLAYPYKNYINKIHGMFQIQKKLDGYRLLVYRYKDGSIRFFTRSGLELFDFPQIKECFDSVEKPKVDVVFDGECIANDSFKDTQKLVLRKEPKYGLTYNVFDMVTQEEWESGESNDTLFVRYDRLYETLSGMRGAIEVVPELYRGDDQSQITELFTMAKKLGWEGIMVKFDTQYVRTRSASMLKVKEFDTLDLRVVRINEGTGKFMGKLGSITVDFDGNEVDVGSGLSDVDREMYWKNPNLIVDKVVEISYFEKTANESGKPSLRFPIFKGIRHDKI